VVKPDPDYLATLVDAEDKLLTGVDLQGAEIMTHAGAIVRSKDDAFPRRLLRRHDHRQDRDGAQRLPGGERGRGRLPRVRGVAAARNDRSASCAGRKILAQNFVEPQPGPLRRNDVAADRGYHRGRQGDQRDFLNALKPKWSEDGKFLTGLAGFEIIEIELGNPLFDNAGLTLDGAQPQVPVLDRRRHGQGDLGGAVHQRRQAARPSTSAARSIRAPKVAFPHRSKPLRLHLCDE
jgi:hypothetical protein